MRPFRPHLGALLLLTGCCLFLSVSVAEAGVFHTARTLKPRALSLGIEPQVYLTTTPDYALNFHGGFGLARGVDLELQYGFPLWNAPLPQYFGADVEFELLHDGRGSPALSLTGGAHLEDWSRYYFDGTVMVSKVFRRLEPYLAIDMALSLPPYTVKPDWRAVGGLNFHLSRVSELLFELGVGLQSSDSYLSAGFNFYI